MKIALVQQHASDDLPGNLRRAEDAIDSAADQGADVICFAELAFTPFYPQIPAGPSSRELAETIPGPTTERFSAKAAQHGVTLVLNLYERDGERRFDTSPIIGPDGALISRTRMLHITDFECFHEKGYYDPGDLGLPVVDTPAGRIGVAICYDRHYPEVMRSMGLAGADVVFVPQAGAFGEWPGGVFEAELQAAALQNGFFTALCNRVGQEERVKFAGESFVCAPSGEVIGRAPSLKDDILVCDLDLSQVGSSPARTLFFPDRRSDTTF